MNQRSGCVSVAWLRVSEPTCGWTTSVISGGRSDPMTRASTKSRPTASSAHAQPPRLPKASAQYLRAPVDHCGPQVATRPVQPVPSLAHGGERVLHDLLSDSPRAHQQRSQANHGHPFRHEEPLKLGLIAGRDTRNRTRVRSHYYLRCAGAVICCRHKAASRFNWAPGLQDPVGAGHSAQGEAGRNQVSGREGNPALRRLRGVSAIALRHR